MTEPKVTSISLLPGWSSPRTSHSYVRNMLSVAASLFPLMRMNGQAIHERTLVRPNHLKVVREFLSGTQMQIGQRRLWPYKFDVIPVELISSIYEMFAHASDAQSAKERSTHYTPINLVDLVLSQVFERVKIKSTNNSLINITASADIKGCDLPPIVIPLVKSQMQPV